MTWAVMLLGPSQFYRIMRWPHFRGPDSIYISLWRWRSGPDKVSTLSLMAAFQGFLQGGVPLYMYTRV